MVKFDPPRRFLEETARKELTEAIIKHFKMNKWFVVHQPMPWHSVNYGPGGTRSKG
jgi:hypothetical protein